MNRLQKNASSLKLLHKAKPSFRRAIIANADRSLIQTIVDCCYNVLEKNISIDPKSKKNLAKHKKNLRKLVDRKLSLPKKRKIIQRGGFLSALISAILPALGGLIGGLVPK